MYGWASIPPALARKDGARPRLTLLLSAKPGCEDGAVPRLYPPGALANIHT